MLSHNQIKFINSLKMKKFRQQYKAFIVEGEKGVNELLSSTLNVRNIFAVDDWLKKHETTLYEKQIDRQRITDEELKKVSDLVTPNKVLAIADIPEEDDLSPSLYNGMALALDGIRDPGNMGTMIRTADWFGVNTIICSNDSVDVYNPKVIQATMGSFGRIKIFYTDLSAFLKNLSTDIPIYGALLKGPDITSKAFTKQGIILIGSESHGISDEIIPYINEPLFIPKFTFSKQQNNAESLNASVANGIICYEICSQLCKNNY